MHASLLNVLHDAADNDVAVLVSKRVDVELVGTVQVACPPAQASPGPPPLLSVLMYRYHASRITVVFIHKVVVNFGIQSRCLIALLRRDVVQ